MAGLNLSNSVDAACIRSASAVREALGLEHEVRFEHHITEAYKSIVRQPYERRGELLEVAPDVPNISAKHEGADPDVEATREHPSDIFDYFVPRQQLIDEGLMPLLEQNYLDKHRAVCRTAEALTRAGIGVHAASHLHAMQEAAVAIDAA
jgi:hypothetical protein